jgi:malonate decarboxylase delta subunit/malonate decarboxylase beta subunit
MEESNMALTELNFEFKPGSPKTLVDEWSHVGVVSSGDLEVLIEKGNAYEGKAVIRVMTSVWETVLKRIVETTGLSSVKVSINDNAATPAVVKRRMQQAIANGGGLQ